MPTTLNGRRFYSQIVDSLIVVIFIFAAVASSNLPLHPKQAFRVLVGIALGYLFFKDGSAGASIGKRIFKVHVMSRSGNPIGPVGSLIRNLILILPVIGFVDIIGCYSSAEGQRLSDRLFGFKLVNGAPDLREYDKQKQTLIILGFALFFTLFLKELEFREERSNRLSIHRDSYNYSTDYEHLPIDSRLAAAAEHGDIAELKLLLKDKPDVNRLDPHQQLPIEYAALGGSYEALELLLAAGADPCALTNRSENGGERVLQILTRVMAHPLADPTRKEGRIKIAKRLAMFNCK